jgi:hypothetical protein
MRRKQDPRNGISALCWGRDESEKSPQIIGDPNKFRDSKSLKGNVQSSEGPGVPSDLSYQANPLEG